MTVTVVSYESEAMPLEPEPEPELATAVALLTAMEHVLPKVQMALERTETAFVVIVIVTVWTETGPNNVDEGGSAVGCDVRLVDGT